MTNNLYPRYALTAAAPILYVSTPGITTVYGMLRTNVSSQPCFFPERYADISVSVSVTALNTASPWKAFLNIHKQRNRLGLIHYGFNLNNGTLHFLIIFNSTNEST